MGYFKAPRSVVRWLHQCRHQQRGRVLLLYDAIHSSDKNSPVHPSRGQWTRARNFCIVICDVEVVIHLPGCQMSSFTPLGSHPSIQTSTSLPDTFIYCTFGRHTFHSPRISLPKTPFLKVNTKHWEIFHCSFASPNSSLHFSILCLFGTGSSWGVGIMMVVCRRNIYKFPNNKNADVNVDKQPQHLYW